MSERPKETPETDEFSKKQYIRMAASSNSAVDLLNDALEETENHARKLERERDEARERYNELLGLKKEPKWYNGREIPIAVEEAAK